MTFRDKPRSTKKKRKKGESGSTSGSRIHSLTKCKTTPDKLKQTKVSKRDQDEAIDFRESASRTAQTPNTQENSLDRKALKSPDSRPARSPTNKSLENSTDRRVSSKKSSNSRPARDKSSDGKASKIRKDSKRAAEMYLNKGKERYQKIQERAKKLDKKDSDPNLKATSVDANKKNDKAVPGVKPKEGVVRPKKSGTRKKDKRITSGSKKKKPSTPLEKALGDEKRGEDEQPIDDKKKTPNDKKSKTTTTTTTCSADALEDEKIPSVMTAKLGEKKTRDKDTKSGKGKKDDSELAVDRTQKESKRTHRTPSEVAHHVNHFLKKGDVDTKLEENMTPDENQNIADVLAGRKSLEENKELIDKAMSKLIQWMRPRPDSSSKDRRRRKKLYNRVYEAIFIHKRVLPKPWKPQSEVSDSKMEVRKSASPSSSSIKKSSKSKKKKDGSVSDYEKMMAVLKRSSADDDADGESKQKKKKWYWRLWGLVLWFLSYITSLFYLLRSSIKKVASLRTASAESHTSGVQREDVPAKKAEKKPKKVPKKGSKTEVVGQSKDIVRKRTDDEIGEQYVDAEDDFSADVKERIRENSEKKLKRAHSISRRLSRRRRRRKSAVEAAEVQHIDQPTLYRFRTHFAFPPDLARCEDSDDLEEATWTFPT